MSGGIFIGLGANLEGPGGESPFETCQQALTALKAAGIAIKAVSRAYESEPYPPSDQPWYVNAVAEVETDLDPQALLAKLLVVEEGLGRQRSVKNAPRTIDLDLIAFQDLVFPDPAAWEAASKLENPTGFFVPHLRAHQRVFVLKPLADLAPEWRHPVFGENVEGMLKKLPSPGAIRVMETPL